MAARRVLVVDDEPSAAGTLAEILRGMGFEVTVAEDGGQARQLLEQQPPDLVILDLMLPDVDGLVLCTSLKAVADVPVIICSGSADQRDRVLGLKLGADDFIHKPFDVLEFQARVEAIMRRTRTPLSETAATAPAARQLDRTLIAHGSLTIDPARHRVEVGGNLVELTPTEYRLLLTLARHPHVALTRAELLRQVWGSEEGASDRAVDMHIHRLREKLAGQSGNAPAIVAVRGRGYTFVPDDATH